MDQSLLWKVLSPNLPGRLPRDEWYVATCFAMDLILQMGGAMRYLMRVSSSAVHLECVCECVYVVCVWCVVFCGSVVFCVYVIGMCEYA